MPPTPGWSMCTSSVCARRSNAIRRSRTSSSPSAASAIRPAEPRESQAAAGGTPRPVASGLRTFWDLHPPSFSHPLQVRDRVLTLVLTTMALLGVGTYMSQQIARGLFDTRLDSLSSQTRSILSELRSLAPVDGQAVTQDTLSSQLSSIYNRSADSVYSLTLEPKDPNSSFSTITA